MTVTWPVAPSANVRTDSSCQTPLVGVAVLTRFTPATSLR